MRLVGRDSDPGLVHRLSRRGMLGVAAGGAAALLGTAAGAGPAQAAAPVSAARTAAGSTAAGSAAGPAPRTGPGRERGRGRPVLPPGRLGIQLYSLRDKVAALGFAAVFAELARHGYDEVEFAGYTQGGGPITLRRLRRLARDHGLTPIGSHVGYWSTDPAAYTFAQNLDRVLDDAQELGLTHIGTPAPPFRHGSTVDAVKRAAEDFNTYGAAARRRGMKFYQHNHSEEFSFATDRPSVRVYDVLLAETDPDLVFLELDIYWAYVGRHRFGKRPDGTPAPFDPLRYVLDQPDRFPLFHVKDGERDESVRDGYRMRDVGDGDIDYRRFLSAVGRTHGGRRDHHWQVEHDNPVESFTFARKSSAHLHGLREPGC
ncbi:sugar phosphate isomerase/epimerase [Streptomyces sp. NPDC000594]|uniref:sugar phosphate isomerase/epimerase family protein n=1 Tax=Streptomyces sp. NPDC000594 TaxID=3154261 RepID=UPI0033274B5B